MPKNKGKGGKGKRKGKRNKGGDAEKAELRFKVFGEEYAQVRRVLGNCRVECYCFDGKVRLCHVRGKFKKRVWINKDDFVLVGLRDYQDDKSDIIHKYTTEEARLLRSWGEIPADKANFDDDGALGAEEQPPEVFSSEEENGEAAAKGDGAGGSSDSSDDELWQPNNNRNLPVGGEDEEEEESSGDDSEGDDDSTSEEEDRGVAPGGSKSQKNNRSKQNTAAILNEARRNNSRAGKGGKGGGAKGAPAPKKAEPVDTPKGGGTHARPSAVGAPSSNAGPRNPGAARYNPRGGYAKPQHQQDSKRGIEEEIDFL